MITKKEALDALCRIFAFCEEIDIHLSKDEQIGYSMDSDVSLIKDYIINQLDE